MMFSLQGKTVLITGAAGGIGGATARVCADLGARLVLADLHEPADTARPLLESGAEVRTMAFDVTDRHAVEDAISGMGQLDAVVANAGYCPWDDWHDPDWDAACRRVLDINAIGVIHLIRPVMDRMMAQGRGRIVLVSSVAGRMGGLRASPHYVMAKGGVNALVKWLAQRGAPKGVAVNAVAPGATRTGMVHGQEFDARRIPVGRLAEPDEIAWPIAFLCSDAASYICGATLDVNGGVHMN